MLTIIYLKAFVLQVSKLFSSRHMKCLFSKPGMVAVAVSSSVGCFVALSRYYARNKKRGRKRMPSFDIVSEIDVQEVNNAVENATRELATRFDFRNVTASFEFNDKKGIREILLLGHPEPR